MTFRMRQTFAISSFNNWYFSTFYYYYFYYIRYTSVIAIDFLSQHPRPNHGLWEARGFLLDGEDPPETLGCRKESYFLEFMYVDDARDFVGVVFSSYNRML